MLVSLQNMVLPKSTRSSGGVGLLQKPSKRSMDALGRPLCAKVSNDMVKLVRVVLCATAPPPPRPFVYHCNETTQLCASKCTETNAKRYHTPPPALSNEHCVQRTLPFRLDTSVWTVCFWDLIN